MLLSLIVGSQELQRWHVMLRNNIPSDFVIEGRVRQPKEAMRNIQTACTFAIF
jgi:hypothetical protein